jgi:hypothetical protein
MRIGESGGEPRDWLDDEDPGIRGCAALAPALAGDRNATQVLRRLASSARAFDRALGFGGDSPALRYFVGPPRWALAEAVCDRVGDPQDVLEAAFTATPRAFRTSPCPEVTPYLRVAFPHGWPRAGTGTATQLALVHQLTDRPELWNGNEQHRAATLRPLGLPDDLAAWQELLRSPAPSPRTFTAADIMVIEGMLHAVRMRPGMYLDGARRDDPRLISRIIQPLVDAFAQTQGTDGAAGWNLTIESDSTFILEVDGSALNADCAPKRPSRLTTVLTWPRPEGTEARIGIASAWSSAVRARTWYDGRAYEQELVDMLPLRSPVPVGEMPGTGYRIEFGLDVEYLPPGSAIPASLNAHPRVRGRRP